MALFGSCEKCGILSAHIESLEAENKRLWSYLASMRAVTLSAPIPQSSVPPPADVPAVVSESTGFRRSPMTVREIVHNKDQE